MGAFENIEQLTALVAECLDEVGRVWRMPYNPSDEKQIRYRYNAYCDQIEKLEDVAGGVIDFCKDLIENSPKVNYEFYCDEVFHNLDKVLEGGNKDTLWFRSKELLLWYYDKVKIYEREETTGICLYHYENTGRGEFVTRRTFSNGQWWDDYSLIARETYRVCLEYCKLRESFEYKLLSLLCHYKENKKGNVNIDYARPMIVFAHAVCLYTVMHNEIKPLLKDAKYAGLNLEELHTTASAPQGKRTKPVTIPHEFDTTKGRALLRKVIKAGYCDKDYNWDDTKWKPGKSRLALACFAYRASAYLNLSTKTNKEGDPTTNWQPFETLFTYQGKEEGKNKLMQAKKDYMRTKTSFNPEEMDEISKLFH